MFHSILGKIFGKKSQRDLKNLYPIMEKVKEARGPYAALDDDALRAKTDEFRARVTAGETLDEIMIEAFGVAWEACRRLAERGAVWSVWDRETVWNMVPYDVQIIGGIVMHQGKIAEMATGEGKTLVAVLPLYLIA